MMVPRRGLALHDLVRVAQLLLIALAQLCHAVLSVQLLPNFLVGSHELVDLPRQLIVLVADDPDVVVHRVNLNLHVGI